MPKLSPHFTLEELLVTSHKDLKPLQKEEVKPYINNLTVLCNYILEPIRTYYGKPITVTSGFRGNTLNKRVGGSLTSQHCFDTETEILTTNGWKRYNTITKEDKCYSYNINTKKIEIVDIQDIIIRDYNGPMYCAETKDIDYCATDKHRFLVKTNKYKRKTNRITKDEYHKSLQKPEWQFKTADTIHSHRAIHLISGYSNSEKDYDVNLLKLAMAVICDGYVYKKKNCNKYHFGFNLAKQWKIEHLKELLEQCNIKYTLRQDKSKTRLAAGGLPVFNFYINSTQAQPIIELIGKEKLIPKFVLELKPTIIKQLVEEYAFFDGTLFWTKTNCPKEKNFGIFTIRKHNAEILQIMCLISGFKATLTSSCHFSNFTQKNNFCYRINVTNKQQSRVTEKCYNIKEYNGKVWCISNKNQTVITRRKGKVLIAGNCLGEAVDILVKGVSVDQVFEDVRSGKINICYRQLIKEKINGVFWNHISMVKIPFNDSDKKYMQKLTTKDGKTFVEVK